MITSLNLNDKHYDIPLIKDSKDSECRHRDYLRIIQVQARLRQNLLPENHKACLKHQCAGIRSLLL